MRFAIGYFVFGTILGIWAGASWPSTPHRTLPPHDCGSALGILEQSIPTGQTPHLRASRLLAQR